MFSPAALWADVSVGYLQLTPAIGQSLPVAGVVETVHVVPGQRVVPGQALITLSAAPFELAVEAAQAERDRLEPALRAAERELEQAEELYARTVLSEFDRIAAEEAYTTHQAAYQRAQSQLARAQLNLKNSVLRAHTRLLVVELRVTPGSAVSQCCVDVAAIDVVPLDGVRAEFRLPQSQVVQFPPGSEVELSRNGSNRAKIKGRVIAWKIDDQDFASASSVVMQVHIEGTALDGLWPGEEVRLEYEQRAVNSSTAAQQ